MSLAENQPTPTRCPTWCPLAFGPTAVTWPTTSWPRIAGYCEMPQSLLKTERSEWHKPQCSTATSTSSAPSGPRSTVSSAIGCLAAFTVQALYIFASPVLTPRPELNAGIVWPIPTIPALTIALLGSTCLSGGTAGRALKKLVSRQSLCRGGPTAAAAEQVDIRPHRGQRVAGRVD